MTNNTASTSTLGAPISLSRVRRLDLKKVNSREATAGVPFTPPISTAKSTSSGKMGEPSRRLRPVPPSAAYEPPTPPSPEHTPLPEEPDTAGTRKSQRPRLRLRYSSDESAADSDSEEEVPWWTFTNRGAIKMRQRRARDQEQGIESGRERTENTSEEPKQRIRTRFRKASRDDPKSAKDEPGSSQDAGAPLPLRSPDKKPSPMRSLSHFAPNFRRQSDRSDSEADTPTRKPFKRSNSAPETPEVQQTQRPQPSTPPLYPPHRQASAPLPIDNVSDSEAHMVASPRIRAKSKLSQSQSPDKEPPRQRRMNSHQLRIRLPPPITQHFSHGWPHAGSWQDALRGTYDEPTTVTEEPPTTSAPADTDTDTRDRESDASPRPQLETRKSRRTRRYRIALAPPTPNGLGFEPRDEWKAGRAGSSEFRWTNPVPEGDELGRSDTRASPPNEKGTVVTRRRGRRMQRTSTATRYFEDWRTRWRRMLFLDARLTIYIRLFDLIVVATVLGLAVSIRLSLIQLNLPGLIGASTTLIISFAAFTLLHGVMAIYREYFGKPIGLWGLRSKMLWVCLDILFVALWASVLALAVNDYISTPLECAGDDPWWTAGLSSGYARLLDQLGIDPADVVDPTAGTPITGVDLIKATLGIVLPDAVTGSSRARGICYRQRGCIALSLLSLLLYGGNMVLSLFRIFETVRRSANVSRAVMV